MTPRVYQTAHSTDIESPSSKLLLVQYFLESSLKCCHTRLVSLVYRICLTIQILASKWGVDLDLDIDLIVVFHSSFSNKSKACIYSCTSTSGRFLKSTENGVALGNLSAVDV